MLVFHFHYKHFLIFFPIVFFFALFTMQNGLDFFNLRCKFVATIVPKKRKEVTLER